MAEWTKIYVPLKEIVKNKICRKTKIDRTKVVLCFQACKTKLDTKNPHSRVKINLSYNYSEKLENHIFLEGMMVLKRAPFNTASLK